MASLFRKTPGAQPTTLFLILSLFLFFCSTAQAASAVLGVDLGTEYIKAALVKPGIPLEIVLTKDSRRKETSAVAFKPVNGAQSGSFPERAYGSDAVALSARFPGDVYPNLKPLLGLGTDNSLVKEYSSRRPALQLEAEKTRGTAAFKSSAFGPDEEAWTVEEILAMELMSIQKNAEALAGKGSVIKDIVLTIPVFYTAEEKRAIQLAADLAGLRILSMMSDGLAVGLNYATTRTFPSISEGAKPEHHLVFDMGAGSTKVSLLRMQGRTVKDTPKFNKTIQEVQVLGNGWDRTLGGDAFNAVIVDDMVAKFIETPAAKKISPTVEDVKAHGRAAAKLWKEAERIRQVLSANTEAQGSFEGLYEDVDFRYKITRTEFEKLTEAHAARVAAPIEKALDLADLEITDLDSIILHGGAVRTPFVQKVLEKIIGDAEKIRSNVNADEAAVFGAAFKGASLSPSFRVKEIRSYEAASYAVGVKWTNIYDKPEHLRMFHPQSSLGVEKTYTFKNQADPFLIRFYQHVASSENVSGGSAEKELINLTTKNLNESVALCKEKYGSEDGDILIHLTYRLALQNGLPEITQFVLKCDVDETTKGGVVDGVKGLFGFGGKKSEQEPLGEESTDVPVESSSTVSNSADASATPDAKASKRTEVIKLDYDIEHRGLPELSAKELTRIKDRLAAFDESDRSRRLREEALNQLEGFTYKTRDLLESESFIEASTDAERAELESKSAAASEWLYGDGAEANREELKARLKELKDIVAPIEKRRDEAAKRPESIKSFESSLDRTKSIIKTIKDQIALAASSSISSETSTTTEAPQSTSDDFDGLEDEESTSTSTTSSKKAAYTPPPPVYTEEDIESLETALASASSWFVSQTSAQIKLSATDDPVLLVKDLSAKMLELDKASTELLMKGMRAPPRPKSSSTKKAKKTKTSKQAKKTKEAKTEEPKAADEEIKAEEMPTEEVPKEDIKHEEL